MKRFKELWSDYKQMYNTLETLVASKLHLSLQTFDNDIDEVEKRLTERCVSLLKKACDVGTQFLHDTRYSSYYYKGEQVFIISVQVYRGLLALELADNIIVSALMVENQHGETVQDLLLHDPQIL